MNFSLYRGQPTPYSTPGKLYGEGALLVYTLELPIRDGKPGSAIPAGTYPIQLAPSPKFQKLAEEDPWWKQYADAMPHLCDIPGRSLIMIHVGDTPKDTAGCILAGLDPGTDVIGMSRLAFAKLYPIIQAACQSAEGCAIQVLDPPPADPTDSAWPNS